jgi:hypothetical protein
MKYLMVLGIQLDDRLLIEGLGVFLYLKSSIKLNKNCYKSVIKKANIKKLLNA